MQYLDQLDAVTEVKILEKVINFEPPGSFSVPVCIHGGWENNHRGLISFQIVCQTLGQNLYFTFCNKSLKCVIC